MHELKRDGDAERVIRAAYDAAALDPSKAIHVFIACGSDSTINAGAARTLHPTSLMTEVDCDLSTWMPY